MKKWIRNILITLAVLALLIYFAGVPFMVNKMSDMVLNYEPYTFELVLNDTDMVKNHYYMEGKSTPADYGFENYEEITYSSVINKDIQLSGWFVHSAPSDTAPCVIISHGRTSNRLKPMKYIELFRSMGLDSSYNFFLPDYRNSGKSTPTIVPLGNGFAEDMTATILMLNEKFDIENITLYSFSMGAMATGVMLWRDDLKPLVDEKGITIDKVIFDSALSNNKGMLQSRSKEMGLPQMMIDKSIAKISKQIVDSKENPVLDAMRMSTLLKDVEIPMLFLHNEADQSTTFPLLKAELDLLPQSNIKTKFFKNEIEAEFVHVRMYIHYPEEYQAVVKSFLEK